MKKVLKFLFSRLFIVGVLILAQIAMLMWGILELSKYFLYFFAVLELISITVVIWIITKNENPSYKLAWVISILIFPLFGGLFYLMFGNKRIPKALSLKMRTYAQTIIPFFGDSTHLSEQLRKEDSQLGKMAEYIENASDFPLYSNTDAEYCPLGEDMHRRLLEEIEKAEKFIFLEYFIIEQGKMWDPVLEILKRKVKQGVEVRVMYDDLGSIQTLPTGYFKKLREFGIKAELFNEFRARLTSVVNYRDHRKIAVIDGSIGFCGGINLADEYINEYEKHGHWKDTAVILKGDAVWSLTLMFLTLWSFDQTGEVEDFGKYRPTMSYPANGYVQAFGDSPIDDINVGEYSYMQILNRASKYVYITTPYLILDNEMVTALVIAAQSGVDVRIITPHIADKWYVHAVTQAYYQVLIKAGVKIYEYTPGFVHAKMYVSDDKVAIVGTTNMDYRSFYLHFECGTVFYNASIVNDVRDDIVKTLEACQQITLEDTMKVPVAMRLTRSLLKIFAPMM